MSKFTKGEWEADDWGKHIYTRSDKYFEPIVQMQGWSFFTGTNGLNLTAEEAIEMQKANARLIAAAPKMYERLKLVARLISRQTQGQLRDPIDPAIVDSIYELLASIDDEPVETMKYSSTFFQNRNCEYFPCHYEADPDKFSCLFCFCPLYHMEKCPGTPRTLSNGVKDCFCCTWPHEHYEDVIRVLREEAKHEQS